MTTEHVHTWRLSQLKRKKSNLYQSTTIRFYFMKFLLWNLTIHKHGRFERWFVFLEVMFHMNFVYRLTNAHHATSSASCLPARQHVVHLCAERHHCGVRPCLDRRTWWRPCGLKMNFLLNMIAMLVYRRVFCFINGRREDEFPPGWVMLIRFFWRVGLGFMLMPKTPAYSRLMV